MKKPIVVCCGCGKRRDEAGNWTWTDPGPLPDPVTACSHGICPECLRRLYPAFAKRYASS